MKSRLALISLLVLLMASTAMAGTFSEPWEGYTNGATPYDGWELQTGDWGSISTAGLEGSECYSIASAQTSRIRRGILLDNHTQIVLQGWFNDSGNVSSSMLGFADDDTADNGAMIRIGANSAANYQVQYYSGGVQTIDTGLAVEAGWHFARLDMTDMMSGGIWSATYRIWNAAKTIEKKGSFGLTFLNVDSNWVTLGSALATGSTVKWDDINVGSLADVGTAPSLPPPAVPEPGSLLALASCAVGLAAYLRRRRV